MKVIESTRALKNESRLREIQEDARRYQQYFAAMRAEILKYAVPTYVLDIQRPFEMDMEVRYSPEVNTRLDWIKKMEDEVREKLERQILDAGYDINKD